MKTNRLAGHTLPDEGRVRGKGFRFVSDGVGLCSCGATSERMLTSDGARKRWHRQHKDEVRAAMRPEVTE